MWDDIKRGLGAWEGFVSGKKFVRNHFVGLLCESLSKNEEQKQTELHFNYLRASVLWTGAFQSSVTDEDILS